MLTVRLLSLGRLSFSVSALFISVHSHPPYGESKLTCGEGNPFPSIFLSLISATPTPPPEVPSCSLGLLLVGVFLSTNHEHQSPPSREHTSIVQSSRARCSRNVPFGQIVTLRSTMSQRCASIGTPIFCRLRSTIFDLSRRTRFTGYFLEWFLPNVQTTSDTLMLAVALYKGYDWRYVRSGELLRFGSLIESRCPGGHKWVKETSRWRVNLPTPPARRNGRSLFEADIGVFKWSR